jgi:hypothetical protein
MTEATNAAPAAAQTTAEGVQPPQSPNAEGGQNPSANMVTREMLDEILTKQRNSIFAEIRRTKTQEPTPVVKPAENLEQIRAEIIADRQAAIQERIEGAVVSAIASFGVDSDNAEILEDHIHRRYGGKLKAEGREVYVENDLGEKIPVKSFVDSLLKSKKGERFKPAPAVASLPRGGSTALATGKAYHEMSQDERLKLSPAERSRLVRRDMGLGQ